MWGPSLGAFTTDIHAGGEPPTSGPRAARAPFETVVIGASLGGVRALIAVLGAAPAAFPASIVVVQHRSPLYASRLPQLLRDHTALAVEDAEDGTRPRAGAVYVAPTDRHLTFDACGTLRHSRGARVNFARPSVDVLFASAARAHGPRAIAVVLTGLLHDGAAGARAVKAAGGRVLVQERATARAASMPSATLATGCVDFELPLPGIAAALLALVMVPGAASLLAVSAAGLCTLAR